MSLLGPNHKKTWNSNQCGLIPMMRLQKWEIEKLEEERRILENVGVKPFCIKYDEKTLLVESMTPLSK